MLARASVLTWSLLALLVVAVSATLTWLSIAYAHRRALIDLPGQRRSHRTPTPRGGGIGIVGGLLVAIAAVALSAPQPMHWFAVALGLAVGLVAGIGWLDDHRSVSARVRFVTHCLAAGLLLGVPFAMILGASASASMSALYVGAAVIPLIAIVWSVNLHNFMDGIDGILAIQAIFVLGVLACCFAAAGDRAAAGTIALFAAAAVGFVPFNFPRARVFMGDVGSGALGVVIAVCVLWQMTSPRIAPASGLVACSAFVVDASLTLVSRMLRGRRWYSAHREHLYQWLVRSGFSHAGVVAMYTAWNLSIVLPVVVLMNRTTNTPMQVALAVATYVAGGALWWFGKRACLRASRSRRDA